MVLDVATKKITLYGKETKTNYKDNSLVVTVKLDGLISPMK
jgi:hypothetical protein